MWILAQGLPVAGPYRAILVAITLLVFLAIATRGIATFIVLSYCRGVQTGNVPYWAFHLEAVRRYLANEPLDDMQGPGEVEPSSCINGYPGPG